MGRKSTAVGSAYDKALALLARREHSRRELKVKLEQRGFERSDSDNAIAKLQSQQYQSDQRFAESVLRRRIADGYGPNRIAAELQSHAMSRTQIQALLQAADPDWRAIAKAQLHRRYGNIAATEFAERGKRAQFLLRRGFDMTTVRKVIGEEGVDCLIVEHEE